MTIVTKLSLKFCRQELGRLGVIPHGGFKPSKSLLGKR